MFSIYVLKSENRNYIYVGLTENMERRLDEHNKGRNATTRAYKPFVLLLIEKFETRIKARQREKYLKSGIGKEWIKNSFC